MDAIFRVSNLLVLPFWALMILFPRRHWATRIMRSPWVIIAPAALYAVLVLPRLSTIWPAVSSPTLAGVAALLGSPAGATIAWVHFLAFDLFVGRWIYLDSNERQISVWLIAPILFLTLMLGPFGFLLYLTVRSATSFVEGNKNVASNLEFKESTEQSSHVSAARISRRLADSLLRFVGAAFEINRPLTIMGGTMLLVLLATVVGLCVDHRVITGVPAWLKPAKFAISVSIYCFTFVWLLSFIENHPRLVRFTANVTVISFVVEMLVIITQAARGTTSHFNMTTPLNSFLWMSMGLFITFVWSMNLLLAIMLVRQRIPDRTFAWSLRLGVIISSIGMAVAFLMVKPTPAQIAFGGHGAHIVGAHSVGVADSGPGLPVFGWSTVGGDLRAAHFVGLHALQVLPFLGWLLRRKRNSRSVLDEHHRLTLICTGGFSYLGLVLLLTWQALRGQSVIHPDPKTLTTAIALASAAGLSTLITLMHAFRTYGGARGLASQSIPDAKTEDIEMTGTSLTKRATEVSSVVLGLALLLLPVAPLIAQTASSAATLTIRVAGARNSKGKIGVALFRDATGFPGDSSKAFRVQQAEIDGQTLSAQVIFEAIPKGTYAVSVFHDENMNGKLDKNFVGAPKEGYGASNNPKKRMGPPKFDEAKFSVDKPQHSIEIKLIY